MKELVDTALETCSKAGASYADIRIVTISGEDITVKKGIVQRLNLTRIKGFGIRALANGGLGFAGSFDLTGSEVKRVAELAVRIATASGSTRKQPVQFIEKEVTEDSYQTSFKKNPFKVPVEEKIDVLVEADKRMALDPAIKMTTADYRAHEEDKIFACTEGSYIKQQVLFCGGGISCVASGFGSTPQIRSYPGSFRGDFATRGYEYFEKLDLSRSIRSFAGMPLCCAAIRSCPNRWRSRDS